MKMKRQQDREGSPRSKRSRASYGIPDHELDRDRMSPDFDRRGGRKFMGGGREGKPFRDYDDIDSPRKNFRDDRMHDPGFPPHMRGGGGYGGVDSEYRSLCITNIPSKVTDAALKETLMAEYWRYGEMNVKVTFSGDQRVAYLNFRYPEDARAAKHKGRLDLFDRPIRIDPVYNKRRSGSPGEFNRDHFFIHNRRNSPHPPPPPPPPPNLGNRMPGGGGRHGPPNMGRGPPNFPPDHPMMYTAPPMHEPERRNEKFPFHLDHIDPEFDDKATRTLFIGNLDVNIGDLDLKRIFEKFGYVEDIDIKRPKKGEGNAYAFIKFINLDCAHRAKVEMSGKYIGKFQCKIGYGKVTPTTCLWIGGIGPWVSRETLEQEFDRFGAIQRIEWTHGKAYAYILYDNIDAAQAACQEMRGCPLGGPDRRLRVDFADISHINNPAHAVPPERPYLGPNNRVGYTGDRGSPWRSPNGSGQMERGRGRRDDWYGEGEPPGYRHTVRLPEPPEIDGRRGSRDEWGRDDFSDHGDRSRRRPRSPGEFSGGHPYPGRSRTPDRHDFPHERGPSRDAELRGSSRSDAGDRENNRRDEKIDRTTGELDDAAEHVRTLADLAKSLPVAWNGALILKNSAFAARMHVVSGDVTIVDTLMRDPTTTEPPVLRITQRLRLDQPKLDDVGRRISSAGPHGHCILLAMSSTIHNYDEQMGVAQQRPLKNLVSYLKQKDAAGVISLPPNPSSDKNVGVLHAFPPCQFGYNFLRQRSPKLPPEVSSTKDDYLVVVVVVGAN